MVILDHISRDRACPVYELHQPGWGDQPRLGDIEPLAMSLFLAGTRLDDATAKLMRVFSGSFSGTIVIFEGFTL